MKKSIGMTDEEDSREDISDMGDASRNMSNFGNNRERSSTINEKVKVVNEGSSSIDDPYSQ